MFLGCGMMIHSIRYYIVSYIVVRYRVRFFNFVVFATFFGVITKSYNNHRSYNFKLYHESAIISQYTKYIVIKKVITNNMIKNNPIIPLSHAKTSTALIQPFSGRQCILIPWHTKNTL